ncbi:hypothetical protein EON63_18525 [archaeon]|nr:MAG: hypothetical protein EON63_18525 [archaeon]
MPPVNSLISPFLSSPTQISSCIGPFLTTLSSTLLGNIYIYGIGAPSWVERGIQHVQSVCRHDDGNGDGMGLGNVEYVCEMAEVLYGFCHDRGLGVQMDPRKSVECFKRASKTGYAVAICNLGTHYVYFLNQYHHTTYTIHHTSYTISQASCTGTARACPRT